MGDASNLGVGVMLAMLGGNSESVVAWQSGANKKIASVALVGDELVFAFDDLSRMAIADEGQSCCESRYMVCCDDLTAYTGATLLNAEVRDGPDAASEYGEHQQQFLIVTTSAGAFTVATHNEHNGYYGGFAIRAKVLSPVEA